MNTRCAGELSICSPIYPTSIRIKVNVLLDDQSGEVSDIVLHGHRDRAISLGTSFFADSDLEALEEAVKDARSYQENIHV